MEEKFHFQVSGRQDPFSLSILWKLAATAHVLRRQRGKLQSENGTIYGTEKEKRGPLSVLLIFAHLTTRNMALFQKKGGSYGHKPRAPKPAFRGSKSVQGDETLELWKPKMLLPVENPKSSN